MHISPLIGPEPPVIPPNEVTEQSNNILDQHQMLTLRLLCDLIIPPDEESPGAVQAGAPELIDLLASESRAIGRRICGGLIWLDATCSSHYGHVFAECAASEQHEILNIIASREKAAQHPPLQPGVAFFALVRRLTLDGFFTSAIGYQYLQYIGNDYLSSFDGCPTLPTHQGADCSPGV